MRKFLLIFLLFSNVYSITWEDLRVAKKEGGTLSEYYTRDLDAWNNKVMSRSLWIGIGAGALAYAQTDDDSKTKKLNAMLYMSSSFMLTQLYYHYIADKGKK